MNVAHGNSWERFGGDFGGLYFGDGVMPVVIVNFGIIPIKECFNGAVVGMNAAWVAGFLQMDEILADDGWGDGVHGGDVLSFEVFIESVEIGLIEFDGT